MKRTNITLTYLAIEKILYVNSLEITDNRWYRYKKSSYTKIALSSKPNTNYDKWNKPYKKFNVEMSHLLQSSFLPIKLVDIWTQQVFQAPSDFIRWNHKTRTWLLSDCNTCWGVNKFYYFHLIINIGTFITSEVQNSSKIQIMKSIVEILNQRPLIYLSD